MSRGDKKIIPHPRARYREQKRSISGDGEKSSDLLEEFKSDTEGQGAGHPGAAPFIAQKSPIGHWSPAFSREPKFHLPPFKADVIVSETARMKVSVFQ